MKKDKSLNDEQNLAVYSRGSSILVSAPAGSGPARAGTDRSCAALRSGGYTDRCRHRGRA